MQEQSAHRHRDWAGNRSAQESENGSAMVPIEAGDWTEIGSGIFQEAWQAGSYRDLPEKSGPGEEVLVGKAESHGSSYPSDMG